MQIHSFLHLKPNAWFKNGKPYLTEGDHSLEVHPLEVYSAQAEYCIRWSTYLPPTSQTVGGQRLKSVELNHLCLYIVRTMDSWP